MQTIQGKAETGQGERQLKAMLNSVCLNNDQAVSDIVNDIIKIGQDCLTLELPPSLQVEQRKLFRQTVLKAYPDIFNHSLQNDQSERLDLVEQYIIERLEMARYNVRKRKGMPGPARSKPALPDIAPLVSTSASSSDSRLEENVNASSSANTVSRPPSRYDSNENDAIASFLDSCSPSMIHLLQDFHAFGITKQEMIYAVSRWTPDYIHGFLHRFANFSQTKMTEMEIELLQAHFLHYF